jgi:hypothetical protein
MPPDAHPHEELLDQVRKEFAEILGQSSQGIYIYLDDPHWICNDQLATMLGYGSAKELKTSAGSSFLDAAVASDSQELVVNTYMNGANKKLAAAIPVTWKTKSGGKFKSQVIFVPISYQGTGMSIHFVTAA